MINIWLEFTQSVKVVVNVSHNQQSPLELEVRNRFILLNCLMLFGASARKGGFQLPNRGHLVTEQNRGTLAQQGAGTGSNLDPGCFTVTLQ